MIRAIYKPWKFDDHGTVIGHDEEKAQLVIVVGFVGNARVVFIDDKGEFGSASLDCFSSCEVEK